MKRPFPPRHAARDQGKALWTWLAGHYRYAAAGLGEPALPWPAEASPEIFLAEAAAKCQAAANPAQKTPCK